jgi:hypothetical protein
MLRALTKWQSLVAEKKKRVTSLPQNAPKKPPKIMLEPTAGKVVRKKIYIYIF